MKPFERAGTRLEVIAVFGSLSIRSKFDAGSGSSPTLGVNGSFAVSSSCDCG